MTDNQFLVLEVLHDNKDKSLSENEICNILGDTIGRQDVLNILSQFDKRDFLDPQADGNKISNIGINKYQSFLFLRQSLDKAQSKTNREKNINRTLSLIGAGGVLWGATFTYLNYDKTELLKQKDHTIHRQQTQTDSLQKILHRQQKTIDSLQTFLSR